jgi:hypothetical protein
MTDYEKLKELLVEFGLDFEHVLYYPDKAIRLTAGSRKMCAYCNLYTEYLFNSEGEFIEVGIYD